MNDPKHPLWGIVRMSISMIALTTILWLNASHFDKTELIAIISMFGVLASNEGVISFIQKKLSQ